MNSIARLILRRVISGNIALTPQVLKVLQECNQDHAEQSPKKESPKDPSPSPKPAADESRPGSGSLTFVNPLPGRWIRRTECGLGFLLLLSAGLAQAAPTGEAMAAANTAFAQGQFSRAVCGYEGIIAQSGFSAPVLFNLANAQQRAGQLGAAILNYERAALLDPSDPDIITNLSSARRLAGLADAGESSLQQIARALTMDAWADLAAAAIFLIAAMRLLKFLVPPARRAWNLASALGCGILLVAAGALVLRASDCQRAVVTASDVVAGIAPVTMAQPMFRLQAGEAVAWRRTHGDFVLVRNRAGNEGWVGADKVTRVIPATAGSTAR